MVISIQDGFDTTRIPDGIWLNIFEKLTLKDYCQMRLTCKNFFYLSQAKRLRKWKLKLDSEEAVRKFKAHIDEQGADKLPISTLKLQNLKDTDNLDCILKTLSKNIRVLYLVDAQVFQNVHHAHLISLEELYLYFEQSVLNDDIVWDIKCYRRLHSIDFALRESSKILHRSIVTQLLDAGESIRLRNITLSYANNDDEQLLRVLKIHARYIKYLNMFCRTECTLRFYREIAEIFRSMSSLESISLSGNCSKEFARGIFNSLSQATPLKTIAFEFTAFDSDEILKIIVPKWSNSLTNVKLISNRTLTSNGLNELSKVLHKLESLEMEYQQSINLMDIANVVATKKNEKLRQLICNDLGSFCDASVEKLATNLPNLENLELSDNRVHLTNRSLGYVFENLKGLRKLCIGCYTQTFPQISQLTRLEELNLNYCRDLTSDVASDLVFPSLRKLNLNSCKNITSEGFIRIARNCPALEALELKRCDSLDDEAVYFICRNLKKLRKLNIKQCDKVTAEAVEYAVHNSGIRVEYKHNEFDGMYYWLN